MLHGKEKNAVSVLKKIYGTQELAENYLDKIKSNANALSLREQFKLIRQWSVIRRCENNDLIWSVTSVLYFFLSFQNYFWNMFIHYWSVDWRKCHRVSLKLLL